MVNRLSLSLPFIIHACHRRFRQIFPYYYDACNACSNREQNKYFGCVYSDAEEREYQSGRTELYRCGKCENVSRFPRYNHMVKVRYDAIFLKENVFTIPPLDVVDKERSLW